MKWLNKIDQTKFSIILLFLLIAFLFAGFLGDSNTYLIGNLVPELTGVCLELLIIIFVFNRWQEARQKLKLISLERRLREYLIFFLKHNFKTLPQELRVGKFFGKDHEKNINQLDNLINHINSNGLSEKEIGSIRYHCASEASTLENLLPVASELSNDHFKYWCRIVYFVNGIARSQESINKSTTSILINIKRFDTASHEQKLYVGAENV